MPNSVKTEDFKPHDAKSFSQVRRRLRDFLDELQLLHYMDDLLEMGVHRVKDLRFVTQKDIENWNTSPMISTARGSLCLPTYRRKLCMCLGVNDYKHWPKLSMARDDAIGLASFFCKELGFESTTLTEGEVTKEMIERTIKDKFASILTPDDLFVLSFHGHGHTKKIGGVEQGFLVPAGARADSNADLISMKSLRSWLEYLQCRHTLLLFDCCFSGLAACLRGRADSAGCEQMVKDHFRNCARLVINAGTKDQMVADSGWGSNHSVFTGALMACPSLHDGLGSTLGLFQWLQTTVSTHSAQTPTIGVLPGHEGGDIYLGLPSERMLLKKRQVRMKRQATEPPFSEVTRGGASGVSFSSSSSHHAHHRKKMVIMRETTGLMPLPVLHQKSKSNNGLKRHHRGLSF
eukprot:g2356.t1